MKSGISLLFFAALVAVLLLIPAKKSPTLYPVVATLSPAPSPYPNLSIDDIFSKSLTLDPYNLTAEKNQYLLIVTGDIIPARSVNYMMTISDNFRLPFEKTADILKKGDITFANFESPLIQNCPVTNEGMIFCGTESAVLGLNFSGIDVVSLANNHIKNYGQTGVDNTVRILEENNIVIAGLDKLGFKKVKDKTFAFLGYNTVGVEVTDSFISQIKTQIKNAKDQSDFTVVMFHWGDEYTARPNKEQIKLAHLTLDAGADLVVGNHPHWVQGIEIYKGKLIAYSHGNFIFDQMWSKETREGVIGAYIFDSGKLVRAAYIPVIIENYSQPRLTNIKEREEILDRMKSASLF